MPKDDATLSAASAGSLACCGKMRDTPFCPDCGKQMSPLVSLLAYCQQHQRTSSHWFNVAYDEWRAACDEAKERDKDPPLRLPRARCAQRAMEESSKRKAKWDAWVSALKEAIGDGE